MANSIQDLATGYAASATPKPRPEPVWEDMISRAGEVEQGYLEYDVDQKRPGGFQLGPVNLFSQREGVPKPGRKRPPNPQDFEGGDQNPTYHQALKNWYSGVQREDARFDSVFGGGSSFENVENSAYEDLLGMRATEEENRRTGAEQAGVYAGEVSRISGDAKRGIQEAFAGRDSQIAAAQQRARTAASGIVPTAQKMYQDVLARFDQLFSRLGRDEDVAVRGFRNDTAAQVEQIGGALRESAKDQATQKVAELGAMGYGLDSPQAAAELRKINGQTREQIGQVSTKAWSDYNSRKLQAHETFSNIRASFAASGLGTIQEAGQSVVTGATDAAKINSEIERWGEAERTATIYNKSLLMGAAHQMELSGLTTAAQMLFGATRKQWIPSLIFTQMLYDTKFRDEQTDIQNFFTGMNVLFSGIDLVQQLRGEGIYEYHEPTDWEKFMGGGGGGLIPSATAGVGPKGGSWGVGISDREAKVDITSVDPSEVLEAIRKLPVSKWRYKENPEAVHMGPMAQDFAALFKLGDSEKHIHFVDLAGVLFSTVKTLDEKIQKLESELREARSA